MATSAPLLASLISQIPSITLEPGVQKRPNVNIRAQIQVMNMEYGSGMEYGKMHGTIRHVHW